MRCGQFDTRCMLGYLHGDYNPKGGVAARIVNRAEDNVKDDKVGDLQRLADCRGVLKKQWQGSDVEGSDQGEGD